MEVEGRARGAMRGEGLFVIERAERREHVCLANRNRLHVPVQRPGDVRYRLSILRDESRYDTAVDPHPSFFKPIGSYTSSFDASALLLSIRIYEPFRNWR